MDNRISYKIYAHRVSYILHHGKLNETDTILHKCDNPSCVNPEHLSTGTQKDNIQDAVTKQKLPMGESCHLSKLNGKQVMQVRKDYYDFLKNKAKSLDVSVGNIQAIIQYRSWKQIK